MTKKFDIPYGKITDEGLAVMSERIGTRMPMEGAELASRDMIRKWVDGVGDPNPLFRDRAYAQGSCWGGLIAPPSFMYSVHHTMAFQGLPGVTGFHAYTKWKFNLPAYEGTRVYPDCTFQGFDDMKSRFAGRMIMEKYRTVYSTAGGEVIAEADAGVARVEREGGAKGKRESELVVPHPWTDEELDEMFRLAVQERPRGAEPNYWEDVEIGQSLTPMYKGPIGVSDMVAFTGGNIGIVTSTGVALQTFAKHPKWAFRDGETRALEPMAAVHWNPRAARTAGVAYAYDIGVQRNSWLIQFLTNWIGDSGWLLECDAEYRQFAYLGDFLTFGGTVTGKYVDSAGNACLEIKTETINQRGKNIMPGRAVVQLPTRERPESTPCSRRRSMAGVATAS